MERAHECRAGQWQASLLKRIVFNSFAGALLAALVSALCGLTVSGLVIWLENAASLALKIPPAPGFGALIADATTGGFGLLGGLMGALIFAIAAARAQPGPALRAIARPRRAGNFGFGRGNGGLLLAVLAIEWGRAALNNRSFYLVAIEDFAWLFVRECPL